MKKILKKIRTNRQVFHKKVEVKFVRPFDSLLRARALCDLEAGSGELKKKGLSPEFEESPIVSG